MLKSLGHLEKLDLAGDVLEALLEGGKAAGDLVCVLLIISVDHPSSVKVEEMVFLLLRIITRLHHFNQLQSLV